MEKELIKRMVVKAKEEQKELTAESGGVKPSISESDIINIVKEVEKDIQKQKERTT
jgi:DNA-binding TFAR19-related protein (PDSD5 family)